MAKKVIKIENSFPVEQTKVKVLDVTRVRKGWETKTGMKTMIKNLIKCYPRIVGFIVITLFLVPDYFLSQWIVEDIMKLKNPGVALVILIWMFLCPAVIAASVGIAFLIGHMCKCLGEVISDAVEEKL